MKELLLVLASVISVFGLYTHIFRGRKLIIKPLMKAELHQVPRHTLKFAWDWGAVTMLVLAVSFLAPIWRADFLPLAMMATIYSYALGTLSFLTMRREGFRLDQMPQWVVFWAASGCGLVSWGVL